GKGVGSEAERRETVSEILDDLRALVERESPSDDAGLVTSLAEWIVKRLAGAGIAAERVACPPSGDAVRAGFGVGSGGTLLVGHLDTVWPAGTLRERPFRVENGVATGPGVFDMKAGIAVAIHAMELLHREGGGARLSLFLTPDEEIGTRASRARLLEAAGRHDRALVLEPSRGGAAKIARKGTGLFEISFSGRAAHAGLEPEKGASALAELARFVLFLETLGDAGKGTSVTPTVSASGTKTNVVPERASLSVDVRVWTADEQARVRDSIESYSAADPRVTVAVRGGFDRPPMEPTPASTALYEKARDVAAGLGWALAGERVGGASDGNLTSAAGIPTLDGLGPGGDGAHAKDEFTLVEDLPRRVEFLSRLIRGLA
ncbi:MAG: M20/M25/M40 family metallo-hydrolase, partial [Thermoanaerobaculia bacterium]